MSFVDYESRIEDHQCLLVLVKAIGSGSKLYGRVFERISRVRRHSQLGEGRTVWLRYVKSYPADASEWGDFQAHRQLLGLLTVGKCHDQTEMEELCHLHLAVQQQYPTAIDSRCLLFGMDTSRTEDNLCSTKLQGGDGGPLGYAPFTGGKLRSTQCLVYPGLGWCEKLEHDVEDFAASLVWVLESRRLDRSPEKQDRCPLLKAPFESRDFVGLDTESRTFKKRCQGHLRKQVGDLSLQLGLPLEALNLYSEAADLLKGVPDWLWLAATYEGQVAASVALQWPGVSLSSVHRNASFPRTAKAAGGGSSQQSRSLPNGTEPAEYKAAGRLLLTLDEMTERLKEATLHYSKYSHAAVIQMECNVKAARLLAQREKYLMASQFLQNATFMSIPLSRAEKVQWYASMARLYTEVGFHRKAAFHTRVAAIKHSSLEEGQQCYDLLLKCLEGFKIILDPSKVLKNSGWPKLHIQVLSDLIFSAKKVGNYPVAIRHTAFLLETMLHHLSITERKEVCTQLLELAPLCSGSSGPLMLPCGSVLPPVPLLQVPLALSVLAQCPAPQLRPTSSTSSSSVTDSPFIFSPHQRKARRTAGKMDFDWVQGEVCAVSMQLYNPLPIELHIEEMSLLVEGIPFECFPSSLELPAESSPYPVKLLGTPRAAGELHILGYSTRIFGLTSHCRLRDLSRVRHGTLSVQVVAALPQLEVTSQLPLATSFSTIGNSACIISNYALTLYDGQSQDCELTLTNPSNEPVESVEVSLLTKLEREWETFSWDNEALWQQLPIAPHGGSAVLTLHVNGHAPGKRSSKVVEAVVQLRYSGGPGLRARYYRQCGISLSVDLLPCVHITKWDVLPAQVASQCYLVLDILNDTEHEMELSYPEQKCVLIEPHDSCRIPVTVDRCRPTSEPSSLALLEEACRAHLVDSVHLHWYLPAVEKNGSASVSEISWTARMLDTLLLSPLHWDISINGRPYRVEEEYVCTVGEPFSLNIVISNISEIALRKLYLSIGGYQDRQNGTLSYRLDSKCSVVGCDKVFIEELGPQERYEHDFSMAFFLTGAYKLELSCRTADLQSLGSLSALLDDKSPDATHIWKCLPSIEVTIVQEALCK